MVAAKSSAELDLLASLRSAGLEPIDMRNVSRIGVRDGVVTPVRKPARAQPEPVEDAGQPAETSRNSFWAKRRAARARGVTLADAKPAEVLKRYGVTYVVCSIMLSLCSFSLFYALVTSGVIDVVGLLGSIGARCAGARSAPAPWARRTPCTRWRRPSASRRPSRSPPSSHGDEPGRRRWRVRGARESPAGEDKGVQHFAMRLGDQSRRSGPEAG